MVNTAEFNRGDPNLLPERAEYTLNFKFWYCEPFVKDQWWER